MKLIYFFLTSFLVTVMACKDTITYPCGDIRDGLIDIDTGLAEEGINEMLADLTPLPTSNDLTGHEENLSVFVERLNESCDIQAVIGCYACIETFPLLSHVDVTVDSASIQIHRSIDILTPQGSVMTLKNIHP